MAQQDVTLPPQFAVETRIFGNPVQQLLRNSISEKAEIQQISENRTLLIMESGSKILVLKSGSSSSEEFDGILQCPSGEYVSGRWLKPTVLKATSDIESQLAERCTLARQSWHGQFFFQEEQPQPDGNVIPGLRSPQLGALYATLAHWKVTTAPGTVVMPTGTGKTETMLTLLVKEQLTCLLVIVPTSTLRDQIARKFLSLGVLRALAWLDRRLSIRW